MNILKQSLKVTEPAVVVEVAEFTMDQSSELVGMESDTLITAMELAEDAIAGLAGLESVAASALTNGGASAPAAHALIAGYNGVMAPFDVVMSGAAVESFDGDVTSVIGTEGIIDAIKDTTAKIWKAIKDFLQKWWDKVTDFYDKHLSVLSHLSNATAALKEQVEKSELSAADKGKLKLSKGDAMAFTVDGKFKGKISKVYSDLISNIALPLKAASTASGVLQSQLDLIAGIDFKTATAATIKAALKDKGLSYGTFVKDFKAVGKAKVDGDTTVITLNTVYPGNKGVKVTITKDKDEDVISTISVKVGVINDSYGDVKEIELSTLNKSDIAKDLESLTDYLKNLQAVRLDTKGLKTLANEYKVALSKALGAIDKDTSKEAATLIKLYVKGSKGLSLAILSPQINILRQGVRTAAAGYTWAKANFKNLK